jgi:hypothetical protein
LDLLKQDFTKVKTLKQVNTKKYQTEKLVDQSPSSVTENDQETDYGDMSEFRKTVKSASLNQRAASREMPDMSILDRVRQSGVN